jgi:uncharacterized protein
MKNNFFSKAHRALQKSAEGESVANALLDKRVHQAFTSEEKTFVEASHFFFIATAAKDQIDCSFKGGEVGFVRVTGPSQITWPDYDGNLMFRTLGNISENPNVSMIFVNFNDPSKVNSSNQIGKLRLNGRAKIVNEISAYVTPGAKNMVVVEIDFILPNCPRYLPEMRFEQMSLYNPKLDYLPPEPEWKSRDYIKPLLKKRE